MEIKKMPKTPFLSRKTFDGQKDFDKYYIHTVIKQVVKKVGLGEEDYVLVDKKQITKDDIAQTINSQNDEAGIDAYLKNLVLQGEELQNTSVSKNVNDFSKAPEDLAAACDLGHKMVKAFNSLPKELKKDLSIEEFLNGMTQEAFNNYMVSLLPKKEENYGAKKEEVDK